MAHLNEVQPPLMLIIITVSKCMLWKRCSLTLWLIQVLHTVYILIFFFNPLVNHSCWFYLFIYLLCFYQRLLLLLPFVWKSALFLFVIYLLKAHKPLVATTVNSFPTIHIAAALFPIQPDASSTWWGSSTLSPQWMLACIYDNRYIETLYFFKLQGYDSLNSNYIFIL